MNIFDILSNDERVIVYSNKGMKQLITWNQSLTLQMWQEYSRGSGELRGQWEEINCRTLPDDPKTFKNARKEAINWVFS